MTGEVLLVAIIALLAGAAIGWSAHGARTEPFARRSAEEVIRLRGQLDAAHARSIDFGRQQAIETLVAPLRSTLDRVQEQLRDVERTRAGSQASLAEQINTMRASSDGLRLETAQLVTALRAPQVRGRWGEMQLERVVEAAGLTEHIDYVTQASVTTEDGTVRPDLVIRLVGGKNVVVDSKVAFAGYLDAMQARDEATRDSRLKAHARQLRAHVDALAAKEYWQRFSPTPEFVVCFVPADAFLDAALREDHQLLEHAFSRDVVLATPSTLVALLRTIAYTWRQDALAANAAEVHQLGRELYARLSTMGAHVDKLGRSLGAAVESYNQAVGSLESRVLVSARRLNDLKVTAPGDELAAPSPLTMTTRRPQAEEFSHPRVVPLSRSAPWPPGGATPTVARSDELEREAEA
jgi:DNA recombination protein RmuC